MGADGFQLLLLLLPPGTRIAFPNVSFASTWLATLLMSPIFSGSLGQPMVGFRARALQSLHIEEEQASLSEALQQGWHAGVAPWLEEIAAAVTPRKTGAGGTSGAARTSTVFAATPAALLPPRAATPDSGDSTQDVCPTLPAGAMLALHGLMRSPAGKAARSLMRGFNDPSSNAEWVHRALADL